MMDDNDRELQLAIEASYVSQQDLRDFQNHEQQSDDEQLASALHESHHQFVQEQVSQTLDEYKISSTQDESLGCWDCTRCTLTNEPYAPQCSACHARAPPHALTFKPMPEIRFGVEMEIIIPNGRVDGFTCESIAQSLSRFTERPIRFEGYTHETRNYWKIVTDSSISTHQKDLSFELVSPVLQGETGMSSMRRVMDSVRRMGIQTNASCGFHVHVDAEREKSQIASLESLKNIAQWFVSLENAFDLLVALSWEEPQERDNHSRSRRGNNNEYCKSNRLAFGERSNRQRWQCISSIQSKRELVSWMNPLGDRYRKVNMTNIIKQERPSTIEFRLHGGVQDVQQAEAWVRLLLLFCKNAALGRNPCRSSMPEGSSAEQEVLALFELLDCEGLEQFFTIEKRLFAKDRLVQEWNCDFCRRVFHSSRSLSQHNEACGH
jgi:hypothetical protein